MKPNESTPTSRALRTSVSDQRYQLGQSSHLPLQRCELMQRSRLPHPSWLRLRDHRSGCSHAKPPCIGPRVEVPLPQAIGEVHSRRRSRRDGIRVRRWFLHRRLPQRSPLFDFRASQSDGHTLVAVRPITDCRSLYEALIKQTLLTSEKRVQISFAAIRENIASSGSDNSVRWVPTAHQLADALTKRDL